MSKKSDLLSSFKRVTPAPQVTPPISTLAVPAPIPVQVPVIAAAEVKIESAISEPSPVATPINRRNKGASRTTMGRYLSFDDDKKALRELAIYLNGQGIMTNQSKLVRAVIMAYKPDEKLIRMYRQLEKEDGRYKNM